MIFLGMNLPLAELLVLFQLIIICILAYSLWKHRIKDIRRVSSMSTKDILNSLQKSGKVTRNILGSLNFHRKKLKKPESLKSIIDSLKKTKVVVKKKKK